jgi:hypothetical protein
MIALVTLFWMLVGHALADYPLQGEFLATAKNRHTALGALFWRWALPAHALIHGGAVAAAAWPALGAAAVVLGLAEAIAHALIDAAKCSGRLSLHQDQLLHVACKIAWSAVVLIKS